MPSSLEHSSKASMTMNTRAQLVDSVFITSRTDPASALCCDACADREKSSALQKTDSVVGQAASVSSREDGQATVPCVSDNRNKHRQHQHPPYGLHSRDDQSR